MLSLNAYFIDQKLTNNNFRKHENPHKQGPVRIHRKTRNHSRSSLRGNSTYTVDPVASTSAGSLSVRDGTTGIPTGPSFCLTDSDDDIPNETVTLEKNALGWYSGLHEIRSHFLSFLDVSHSEMFKNEKK